MSRFHKELQKCPHCTSEEEVVIWDLIVVEEDPDLKERLLKKQIQVVNCQNCGEEMILALPLLYVDNAKDLVFYYCPQYVDLLQSDSDSEQRRQSDGTNLPEELTAALDAVFPPGLNQMVMRIIPAYNDLIEKIHMSDHELDDRLMEVVKIALKTRYLAEDDIRIEEIFFLSASEDTLLFQVFESERGWNTLEVYREIYENAEEALKSALADEGRWLQVDENYGMWLIKA